MAALAKAKQMENDTFNATTVAAKFATDAFTQVVADDVFAAQSINGSKIVNGEITETQLSSTAWTNGIEGGGGTQVGLDLDGDQRAGKLTFTHAAAKAWAFSTPGALEVGTGSGDTFTGAQVPNADWVLTQSAAGVQWKFPVLVDAMLGSTTDDVKQAGVMWLLNNPTSGDDLKVTDGSTTRTYGFGAGGDVTVTIGATASDTMDNLAAAITGDGSGLWDAVAVTGLTSLNSKVVVIYRADQSAASFDDRMHASLTTPADGQYVNFNGQVTYTSTTSANIPAADPAQKEFGPGTQTADLVPGEAHVSLDSDAQFVWDADGTQWIQISGTGSVIAGAGILKTSNTLSVDTVTNGGLSFDVAGDGGKLQVNQADLLQSGGVELDADRVDVDFVPTNYTVETGTVGGVTGIVAQMLTSHLGGIDTALGAAGGKLTGADKNLTPAASAGADAFDTTVDISETPKNDSYIEVQVNGIGPYLLAQSDAARTTSAFYFSADGGTTARNLADIVATDSLYFNPTVAGFDLENSDRIDLNYMS